VLVALIPVLELLFRHVVAERMGTIILSAIVAHTGWHWMTERWERFAQYHVAWPDVTLPVVVAGMRWGAAIVGAVGILWWIASRPPAPLRSRFGVRRTPDTEPRA